MLESNQKTISGWDGILVDPPVIEKGFLKVSNCIPNYGEMYKGAEGFGIQF
jgi:hypothetical protein